MPLASAAARRLDANVFMHVANKASGYLRLEQCIIDAGAASLRISAVTLAELRFKLLRGEIRQYHKARQFGITCAQIGSWLSTRIEAALKAAASSLKSRPAWPGWKSPLLRFEA